MKKLMVFVAACIAFAANHACAELYMVTGKTVLVRKGPASSEAALSAATKGQIIEGTPQGSWVRSKLADGTEGYIFGKLLKPAKEGEIATPIPGAGASTQSINPDEIDLASPISTTINSRTRIRREAHEKGLAYRYLDQGEEVKVMGGSGGWAKVESKWTFESGKPMIGYIKAEELPGDVVEKVGLKKTVTQTALENKRAEVQKESAKAPLVAGGQQPPTRTVAITLPQNQPAVDVKSIEAARDMAIAQVKALQVENSKLKTESTRHSGELKAVQIALASADSRYRATDTERQKLSDELQAVREQLAAVQAQLQVVSAGGNGRALMMADKGEAVFFKGIGEAQMAAVDGKTVLRFPLTATVKADKVFLGAKAERHLQGAFAYYIVDSKLLAF